MTSTRGIKKVNEHILVDGRALIVTEKDKDNYVWSDIPDGSLFIDSVTGIMRVKVEGESDWVPAGIKNDGTICIAKDTKLVTESYTIENPDDEGVLLCVDEDGNRRRFYYDTDGYPILNLQKGSYQMLRNQISVIIDSCLCRSALIGGLEELSETRIKLKDTLEAGQNISIIYSNIVRIGNPYPRVFINPNTPDNAEVGDVWYDTDDTIGDDPNYKEDENRDKTINWSNITGKPSTLTGFGITDKVASTSHNHTMADIIDLPLAIMNAGSGIATNAIALADDFYIEDNNNNNEIKALTIVQGDGTSEVYDGTEEKTITIKDAGNIPYPFDDDGKLVFPNGSKLWIE